MAPRKQQIRAAKDGASTTDQVKKLTTKAGVQKSKGRGKNTKKDTPSKIKSDHAAILNEVLSSENDLSPLLDDELKTGPSGRTPAKKTPARKRGGKKKKKEEKFMDDFLTPEEAADQLRRSERWIPDIELRTRPTTKPDSIPIQLWMSYCMMEEFVYRQSLTEEEVLSLPLIDDVFIYKQGGPMPSAPPGYYWDEEKNLVPNQQETPST